MELDSDDSQISGQQKTKVVPRLEAKQPVYANIV
jgi:hypothetical protein